MTGDARARVLFVDDDPDFHAVIRGWLAPEYEVVDRLSGQTLFEDLDALEPDVLMLDVRMPGLDGFELCRRLRRERRFQALPVLFLTGCREDEDFVRNLKAGGTAFLAKPVGRRPLLAVLRELLAGGTEAVGTID